jgi:steroid delta-isomerase-like uncharacterized protein
MPVPRTRLTAPRTAAQSKAVVHRWFEAFNRGHLTAADELFAPNFVGHEPYYYRLGPPLGPEGVKQASVAFRAAFPDVCFTIEDLIAEADKVVVRWTWRGTHQGEFLRRPATGRRVTVAGIDLFRIAAGYAPSWAPASGCRSSFPARGPNSGNGSSHSTSAPSISSRSPLTLTRSWRE